MKYYHSDVYKNRNWLDSDESNPEKIIKDFYYEKCYVHDADICGDDIVEFAFEIKGKIIYYRMSYDWYIDYDPEWDIHNNFDIKKINEPTFNFPGNRDWINV